MFYSPQIVKDGKRVVYVSEIVGDRRKIVLQLTCGRGQKGDCPTPCRQ